MKQDLTAAEWAEIVEALTYAILNVRLSTYPTAQFQKTRIEDLQRLMQKCSENRKAANEDH